MIVERVHKPTVTMLHQAGILPAASAARAMLLAYYHLSSARRRPCTVSCSKIAKDLGVAANTVRYALLRWKDAKRIGKNGERRRSWKLTDSVTTCHAPQEEPPKRPAPQNSVTPCHVLTTQNVTPERDAVSRPTTERILLKKKDKEITRSASFSIPSTREKEIKSLEGMLQSAIEINTPESLRHAEQFKAKIAKLQNDEKIDALDRRLRGGS